MDQAAMTEGNAKMSDQNPEIGRTVSAGGFDTNFHDVGQGSPVLLIHGSGPGVTAWANWRTVIPELSQAFRVLAPDMVGFGYTARPAEAAYSLDLWVTHALDFLDALDIGRTHIVGNSFGGALALALAIRAPDRVDRLVLMGSAGLEFELTAGLESVWGYEPGIEAMHHLVDLFTFDKKYLTDDLVKMRYEASMRPGYQDSYASMFPAPRQAGIGLLASPEDRIAALTNATLIVHGRDDRIIPLTSSYRLHDLIGPSELHVFGQCGHWTQIEHNARFCRLVSDFLKGP
jgi:2-hydroxymuconate-semialdehyde hydrolase